MKRFIIGMWIVVGMTPAAFAAEPVQAEAGAKEAEAGSKEIVFNVKFEPGRTTRLKMVTRSVGSLAMPAPLPEQKFSQTFEQVLSSTCRKVNEDGTAVFDVIFEDVVMKMSVAGMTIEYDSRTYKPEDADHMTAMIAPMFQALKGARFSVTMNERGQPIKVEGLKESLQRAAENMGKDEGAAMARNLLNQFSQILGDESMTDQLQTYQRMFPRPGERVKVGDRWEQNWSMRMPMLGGEFEGQGEYELVGVRPWRGRPCAQVRVKESFKMARDKKGGAGKQAPGQEGMLSAMLDKMDMEMSTSGGEGLAYIDYERGELVQLRQTQNLVITMRISDPNLPEEVRKNIPPMTQRIRNSVTVELLESEKEARDED